MSDMEKLRQVVYESLHRREAGIDKLDRLWEAAVLLPLVLADGVISVLFEERAHHLKRQPGEICFPGGHFEESDRDFQATAVRETCEELGISADSITVCGQLDALVAHHGPIIHPFVGIISDIDKINYDEGEVAGIFTVPLKFLLEYTPLKSSMQLADHPGEDFPFELVPTKKRGWRRNKEYAVYFYIYEGHVIWGLTARILYGFLHRSGKELLMALAVDK